MSGQDSVFDRAEKAAKALHISTVDLLKILTEEGISNDEAGLMLLNSHSLSIEDIAAVLKGKSIIIVDDGSRIDALYGKVQEIKALPARAAAGILKAHIRAGAPAPEISGYPGVLTSTKQAQDLAALALALKPIQQWDDKALLENFIATRSPETEAELDRRAKHQKFVVLKNPATANLKKYEPGKEEIDVEHTLDLLRVTRKRTTPGTISVPGGFAIVYRITDLNMQDRVLELCPICGESLYNGYCEKCAMTFVDVSEEARAYVWLIAKTPGAINAGSVSDRKAVMLSASKGVEDLKQTWPSLAQAFEEMILLSTLPKLRVIQNRPSVTAADPFHVDGNRTFSGNRTY